MRFAFSTLGCPSWDFTRILDCARNNGFQGVEVRGIGDAMMSRQMTCFLPSMVGTTKRLLRQDGLSLVSFDTSIALHDDAQWNGNLEEARQAVALCRRMDIPAIRVFGNKAGDGEVSRRVLSRLHALCAIDPLVDVRLETHGDYNTLPMLEPVIREVTEKNFGIIWDVEHSDATYADAWETFYDRIAPWVRQVHLKDRMRGGTLCLTGEGGIPLRAIVRRLEDDGFKGFCSFEWEKRWHPELAGPEVAIPHFARWMAQSKGDLLQTVSTVCGTAFPPP